MKPSITQQHSMACGLACVAYIVNRDYTTLAAQQPSEKLNHIGFYCSELVELLNSFEFRYRWKRLSDDEKQGPFHMGSIVFIKRSIERPGGHFLVKTNYGWMDPWVNLPDSKIVNEARSGYLDNLPGEAEYLIYI